MRWPFVFAMAFGLPWSVLAFAEGSGPSGPDGGAPQAGHFADQPQGPLKAGWEFVGLSHQTKPQTRFQVVDMGNTRVLQILADRSYGNVVHAEHLPLTSRSALQWQWWLEVPNLKADLATKAGDDAPLKVCVLFDYDTSHLGFADRALLSMARASYGTAVPAATLCYVWDHRLPTGTELVNAFTSRMRYIVVDSGETQLHQWVNHRRQLADDFWKTFGPEFHPVQPDDAPMISGIAVGADADNTEVSTESYVADIRLIP